MRCGEDCSRGPALANGWVTHQDQGDPLGDHGAGPEDAEEDEDGRQNVAETQFEGHIEGVGEGRGGQDADRLGRGHHHRGADGQLRGGGQQREDDQGQQQQLTLLRIQRGGQY